MKKQILIFALALLPLCLMAQEQEGADAPKMKGGASSKVFTGFSGGMMLHAGYLFADDPSKVFSNTGLGSIAYIKGLPSSGLCYGFGGELRVHFLNHIHLGGEGQVSTMPLMGTGSNVRTAWGGAFCDFYGNWGKVHPMAGLGIGGGEMKRLYVPDAQQVEYTSGTDTTIYNSSYVKTPFFYLDPYIGMEISFGDHLALLIRIDYMLPFNIKNTGLAEAGKQVTWDHFVSPSGPRLYVGLMIGKIKN